MKESVRDLRRNIVVDTGVLVAVIDADEPDHVWAKHVMTTLVGSFFTCEACITEAVHLLGNSPSAVTRLIRLVEVMRVISFSQDTWKTALAEVARRAPIMDYADACIYLLVTNRRNAFALTLDDRDFSIYRIPFASPSGHYYD